MPSTANQHRTVEANYFRPKHVITQAVLSALVIVFYTTEHSILRSLHKPAHQIAFLLTTLQMGLISLACAAVSTALDRYLPWHQHTPYRRVMQVLLGVVLISFVALQGVQITYKYLLGIDLLASDYFARDFTVVLACIVVINFHHHNLYLNSRVKSSHLMPDGNTVQIPEKTLQLELNTSFEVLESDTPVSAIRAAAFYLQDVGKRTKLVRLVAWCGKVYTLKQMNSLRGVEQLCPYVFVKVSREYLVNRYAMIDVQTIGDRRYHLIIDVPQQSPIPISRYHIQELQVLIDANKERCGFIDEK